MARDVTHELRLRQLREQGPNWVEPQPVQDSEASDWTGKVTRSLQILGSPDNSDSARAEAAAWLRAHNAAYQGPVNWK